MMERNDVYNVVDTERDFQETYSGTKARPDMLPEMSMGDIISAMEYNMIEAKKIWYRDSPPYQNTMEYIRKLLALGVKAGEQYGIPERKTVK
jgi:hypothetical protein